MTKNTNTKTLPDKPAITVFLKRGVKGMPDRFWYFMDSAPVAVGRRFVYRNLARGKVKLVVVN